MKTIIKTIKSLFTKTTEEHKHVAFIDAYNKDGKVIFALYRDGKIFGKFTEDQTSQLNYWYESIVNE
jgi:hypothetical protein